jgi:hypothetical protein
VLGYINGYVDLGGVVSESCGDEVKATEPLPQRLLFELKDGCVFAVVL